VSVRCRGWDGVGETYDAGDAFDCVAWFGFVIGCIDHVGDEVSGSCPSSGGSTIDWHCAVDGYWKLVWLTVVGLHFRRKLLTRTR